MNKFLSQTHALHILKSEAWGGLENYSLDLIQHFNQIGIRSSLLCVKNSRVEKEAKDRNIPILFSNYKIRDSQFSHIHVHRRQDLPLARFFLVGISKPFFYSLYMSASPKKDFYHRWIYNRVNALASSSIWVNEQVKAYFPIQSNRIHLIRYGRNSPQNLPTPMEILDLKKKISSSSEKYIFGTMCRLDEGKGVLELASALLELTDKELSQLELWIIGDRTLKSTTADGTLVFEEQSQKIYDKLQMLSKNPRLIHALKLIPYQKNINLYLQAMNVFLLGSYEETYSLAVIDAMMMGLPIIGTQSGGTIEQIGPNEERGLFFLPKNIKSLSEAYSKALLDMSQLKLKGQNAQAWAQKEHNWKHCLEQWSDIYNLDVINR